VSRVTKDGLDTCPFPSPTRTSGAHFRYIRTKSALYTLSIEFPNAHRDDVAAIKDKFFGSFQLKARS
jgi:hypothetical protein